MLLEFLKFYETYVRYIVPILAKFTFKKRLEQTYDEYVEYIESKGGTAAITQWLLTERAHQIFNDAEPALRNYHVIFKENQDVLDKIYAFLEKDLSENYGENMAKQCPNKKFKINH